MLYWLLVPLRGEIFFFNVFRYITVRTAAAGITALVLSFLLGPRLIRLLERRQIGQEIRPEGPQSHYAKKGTPSMGGILIIICTLLPTLVWGNLANVYVWVAVLSMVLFGLIGLVDDILKVRRKRSQGLRPGQKILLQALLAAAIGLVFLWMGARGDFNLSLSFPFLKQWVPFLGWFYLPWIVFILVGSSNAVNLADGLDGLAIGLTLISATALTALTYVAGHALWSQYLNIARVPLAAELTVFAGAFAGACLGFLWFNCHPAQVFMGDVGALSIGGTMAVIALLIKQEFLLFTVAGVFILEALSVLLQVSYFKLSKGKRIFKMAPLHHHFELSGWPEGRVVIRFWILGIIFALFSLSTLKLR
ncbi:MAG: phospho-N-acetylmuramoyl-pentapeptide-transferase [Candidatus Aminicenantes bacterium RBG_16_63_14]|nr:MAG: phospho-N-acetylmuramoyl-pentapeptide-transferase [Candidatus Aminicenantes bacterium RBG_16_63_14]OGD28409.1 MAG: phospho-N-acetylmuramoyl-pentapeptide-transferase [Candidatus Aminicenantes bacterium RBG_19FT_COMBO_65_30]